MVRSICVTTLFAVLGLLAACKAEYVSIATHPVPLPELSDVMNQVVDYTREYHVEKDQPLMAGQLVALFGKGWIFDPPSVMTWAASGQRKSKSFLIPKGQTWRDVLRQTADWAGPYTVTTHTGVMELAWGTPDKIDAARKTLNEQIPPLAMKARTPAQFLTMWHQVAGEDFLYDRSLIDVRRPGMEFAEFLSDNLERHDKFMSLLAAALDGAAWEQNGTWVIGKFKNAPSDEVKIDALIGSVKVNRDMKAVKALIDYGTRTLPRVIADFERSHDEVFSCLTDALAGIPAPERDQAFLSVLDRHSERIHEKLFAYAFPTIAETLAARQVTPAIPILQRVLADPEIRFKRDGDPAHWNIRACAVVALNNLGAVPPPHPADSLLAITPGAAGQLTSSTVAATLPALRAVLEEVFLPSTSTLNLQSAREVEKFDLYDNMGKVLPVKLAAAYANYQKNAAPTISFSGPLLKEREGWLVRVSILDSNEGIVQAVLSMYETEYCYLGRIEKKAGHWLVLDWVETAELF